MSRESRSCSYFVRQPEPRGMGEAVFVCQIAGLCCRQARASDLGRYALRAAGDRAAMVEAHHSGGNDFTFVSRV